LKNQVDETLVRQKWKSLIAALNDMIDDEQDIENIMEVFESEIYDLLSDRRQQRLLRISVDTGLRDLDLIINGFKSGEFVVIASRPMMGKSTLGFQIAEHVAAQEPVIFFSIEMTGKQIARRSLNFHEDRVGKSKAVEYLKSLKLHVDQYASMDIKYIRSQCRKIRHKQGLSMIVIDNIQLICDEDGKHTYEYELIVRDLKALAKEFDIPVVALSQLNRNVDARVNKRPLISDLGGLGDIEQYADVIMFIYRNDVYCKDNENNGLAEIIVAKNRNNSIGTVTTHFSGELSRFSNFNEQRILRSVKPVKRSYE
jgi:replicative DNA helicase